MKWANTEFMDLNVCMRFCWWSSTSNESKDFVRRKHWTCTHEKIKRTPNKYNMNAIIHATSPILCYEYNNAVHVNPINYIFNINPSHHNELSWKCFKGCFLAPIHNRKLVWMQSGESTNASIWIWNFCFDENVSHREEIRRC